MNDQDAKGVRIAIAAVAALLAAGLATVLALTFIDAGCRKTTCDVEALLMLGLIIPWSLASSIVVARAFMETRFGTMLMGAVLLGWLALHFVAPERFLAGYLVLVGAVGGAADAWAFMLWLLMAGAMAGLAWFGADLAERVP